MTDGYILGIDIGGTFTDMVLLDTGTLQLAVHKCLTTPGDPAEGVMRGIHEWFADIQVPPSSVSTIIHATTLITNSLIERKGASTGGRS